MSYEWIACCEHCGCAPDNRAGHDDTCRFGCNDEPCCDADWRIHPEGCEKEPA